MSDAAHTRPAALFFAAAISLALAIAGIAHGVQRWTELRRDTRGKLAAQAGHTLAEFQAWGDARLATGRRLQHDAELARLVRDWSAAPAPEAVEAIVTRLRETGDALAAGGQLVLTAAGRTVRVWPDFRRLDAPFPALPPGAATAVKLLPFRLQDGPTRQMGLRIPLDGDGVALTLVEDALRSLAPRLHDVRLVFPTGDALLLERVDDAWQLLAATDTFTPEQTAAFAATAFAAEMARGERGALNGRDLRGRATFAHASELPGTPWLLLQQVERDAVEGPFFRQWFAQAGICLLLFGAGAGILRGRWRELNEREIVARAELKRQRDALTRQTEFLNRDDRHAVLTSTHDGRNLEANAHAMDMYGYGAGDWSRLTLADLHAAGPEGVATETDRLEPDAGATWVSRHRTRDGRLIDVEVSVQSGERADGPCRRFVVRDITERVAAERRLRESEELYRSLFHGANDALLLLEGERVIDCNPRALELYGWPREQLVGLSFLRLSAPAPEGQPGMEAAVRGILASAQAGRLHRVECQQRRQDGCTLLAEIAFSPVRPGDRPVLLAIVRDVTEQRRTEEALRQSRAELEEAEALANLGHWCVSLETRRFRCSRQLGLILGFAGGQGEPDLRALLDRVDTEDREHLMQLIDRTIRHGEPSRLTIRYGRPEQGTGWLAVRVEPRRNEAGVVTELFGTIVDQTQQRMAEAEHYASLLRYRSLVERIPAVVYVRPLAADGPASFVSPQVEQITGTTAAEWLEGGDPVDRLVVPEDRERVRAAMARCRAGEAPLDEEYRMRIRDGAVRWVHDQASLLRDREGRPFCVQGLVVDITGRRRNEEMLRLLETALASAANGVIVTDAQGRIEWVNKAVVDLYGYTADELRGQTPRLLRSPRQDPAIYRQLWGEIAAGRVWRGDIVNRTRDNREIEEEMTITPVRDGGGIITHFVAIKQDVSVARALQRQLQQGRKMECLGRLAGGVAHDFNNLLQTISGCGELLQEALPGDSPQRHEVGEILRAAGRAGDLTRQLRAFSRGESTTMQAVAPKALLESMVRMLRRLVGEDISLELDAPDNLPPVQADAAQVEQVMMNLVVNARDAMPAGGRLRLAAAAETLTAEAAAGRPGARAGQYVRLRVEDDGCGMPGDVIEHIFEPFFSTKAAEGGTGLGLAVVYGIIERHGGFIEVSSEPGRGSRFDVWLPVSECAWPEPHPAPRPAASGKGLRVLLVEDDERVRCTVRAMLVSAGYAVAPARSVAAARALFHQSAHRFDVLLIDVVLPDGSGTELAEELVREEPSLRIIFHSGYSDDKSRWSSIRDRGYRLLHKPYPRQELLQALDETPKEACRDGASAAWLPAG